ncbi:hypothetical protein SD937_01410 [Lactobacillus paragasseri]|uniref:prenylated flavin chaperone LpdD n=1 Tax=Lactobacillus paragasseri TaxID=2107999 RepID=UPI0029C4CEF7|nr:hypothetical protein [Lactobacillus paragasseri]MDX5080046.1 hypothetical protein [Lactobacillus paragasseri]
MKKTLTITKSFQLKADCLLNNQDLLVNLIGGNIPHVSGVVTFDQKAKEETVVKFASHDGRLHKDIFLAQRLAEKIEKKLPGNLVINAGVHIDGISKEQIDDSFVMTDEIAKKILAWVQEETSSFKAPKYTTHLKRDASGKLI